MSDGTGGPSRPSFLASPQALSTAILLLGAALVYGVIAFQAVVHGHTSAEEASYLIRSWWYTNHTVAPYTATDATGRMPFYFYQLGFWQQLAGLGEVSSRWVSVALGLVSGLLLFAICRRLTANTLVAAAAVFMLLATPATIVAFATATPAATVSALHLAAIWLIVSSMGRPRPVMTVLMGALLAVLYFYQQHMLLSVIVLAPLYIAAIGRKRAIHTAILVAGMAAVSAAVILSFPERLGQYALRLPVISPSLGELGVLAPNFTLIDRGTVGPLTMGPAFDRFSAVTLLDAFILPYSGILLLALLLFVFARGPLKVLWIAALYFFWLALSHYLAALGYCADCIASYAPTFSAVGALAAALALAMMGHRLRSSGVPTTPLVVVGAAVAVALNAFAPNAATLAPYKSFPIPLITAAGPATEWSDMETAARWISANAPAREPVLALHSLGRENIAGLPYAIFLAGHMLPAQSIDPAGTKRSLSPRLSGTAREAVQAALEEETLWSDETLARWIGRDVDVIVFQLDKSIDQRAQLAAIAARFDLASTTSYKGATLQLYRRKAVQ